MVENAQLGARTLPHGATGSGRGGNANTSLRAFIVGAQPANWPGEVRSSCPVHFLSA